MFYSVPYTVYSWVPPALSEAEEMMLGQRIAKVGTKNFVGVYKAYALAPRQSFRPYSLEQVLSDSIAPDAFAARHRNDALAKLMSVKGVFGLACILGGLIVALRSAGIILLSLIPILLITIGSYLWSSAKIDRWANGLVQKYAASA